MKAILLIVALISMLFVSNIQASGEFCNILGKCSNPNECCTSVIFGYCRPYSQLGEPCKTKTDTEHYCSCVEGLSSILLIVALISILFVSNIQVLGENYRSEVCSPSYCLTYKGCQPLGILGDLCSDSFLYCPCSNGLKCKNGICVKVTE